MNWAMSNSFIAKVEKPLYTVQDKKFPYLFETLSDYHLKIFF